jgi:Ca2+-transporting ATPase
MDSHFSWHTLSTSDVLDHLQSTPAGLTNTEASRRLAEYGSNELQAAHRISPLEILLEQFKNVLIIILLIAVGL